MQRRALVVTTAIGSAETLNSVLTRFGFARTLTVDDRDQAIARMREEHFDLIIVSMDGVSPGELINLEREIRKDPTTSVIATAPSADPELILRAMRAGVHEFLIYPPKAEELSAAVDRLMRRTRSEAQRGELVAVYSAKGGLGSTSIAVNLSHAFGALRP